MLSSSVDAAIMESSQGHRPRGVRHCLIHGHWLFTAGADGSVQRWDLASWVAPQTLHALLQDQNESQQTLHDLAARQGVTQPPVCLNQLAPHVWRQQLTPPWEDARVLIARMLSERRLVVAMEDGSMAEVTVEDGALKATHAG